MQPKENAQMHRHAIFGGRRLTTLAATLLVAASAACSSVTDSLLEAKDPDLIDPTTVQSASGAIALANGTIRRLIDITGGGLSGQTPQFESSWMFGGLLADEWSSSSTFVQNDETDERSIQENNSAVTGQLRNLYRARTSANQAIAALREFSPNSTELMAEMYMIRGYAEAQLASDFCNGIPLSDGTGATPVPGTQQTVAQVFAVAVASYDSALALATSATSEINQAARVGKARALVGLGQLDQAAALVTGVPTSFKYQASFSLAATGSNNLWSQGTSGKRYSVGDTLEGVGRVFHVKNALPFGSLNDPRVPTVDTKKAGQDGQTWTRTTNLWGQESAVDVLNGLDARLIEAEAALKAGNTTQWLAILNALRASPQELTDQVTTPVMAPLTDPGTPEARLDLQFKEKALWTFGRGERLGDLRRLVRQYGRAANTVFPVGEHFKGGNYGTDVNLPITTDERTNPNIGTDKPTCLDRNA
jgi:hypothetical protein